MPCSNYLGGTGVTPRDYIAGLIVSLMPVVMLEAGIMHNATDSQLLTDPASVKAQAKPLIAALAEGPSHVEH